MTRTPKEIRKAARLTLIAVAVGAKKAEGTVRVYEANRSAVSEQSREILDEYYLRLAARAPVTSPGGTA
jgi:hypothetical protein